MKQSKETFDIQEFQDLLYLFKKTFSALYKKETSGLHCSASHMEIMHYIAEHDSASMKDLAGYLRITPPSVTTLIDAMVENGLVRREAAAADRRTVRVSLTPKATSTYKQLQKKKTILLAKLLKKISTEQKEQLSAIIKALVQ
ncbi:MAG: MarR family transcriptional regulator [Patescibacteria group bacterium]